jgi:hypothetical protein
MDLLRLGWVKVFSDTLTSSERSYTAFQGHWSYGSGSMVRPTETQKKMVLERCLEMNDPIPDWAQEA